jgi:hypothetical protein
LSFAVYEPKTLGAGEALGDQLFEDHNVFWDRVDAALKKADSRHKLSATDLKQILKAVSAQEGRQQTQALCHRPQADPQSRELARRDCTTRNR